MTRDNLFKTLEALRAEILSKLHSSPKEDRRLYLITINFQILSLIEHIKKLDDMEIKEKYDSIEVEDYD